MIKNKTLITQQSASAFNQKIIQWYKKSGRKHLPWQQNKTPYRVWISEIMLQQTQVVTVIPYYQRFMESFPSISALAQANEDDVLHHWTGLGYYARARNLHKAAKTMLEQYQGEFPQNIDDVIALPGIGRSTAGAILSLSLNMPHPILDGNVKRVLARCYKVEGHNGQSKYEKSLWPIAETLSPNKDIAQYNQAMMDLGSMVCTRSKPLCEQCPVNDSCLAKAGDEQSLFPQKKPKKVIPEKSTIMVIPKINNKVLMEKRPPAGIWGGLWCFLEVNELSELPELLKQHQLTLTDTRTWQPFRHTFSHFHLDIQPVLVECQEASSEEIHDYSEQKWYDLTQEESVGLAASTQKLLQLLKSQTFKTI